MDNEDTCQECNTSKANNPRIQFRFSTCCGHSRCTDCIGQDFRFAQTAVCKGCGATCAEKDYMVVPIDEQRFNREAEVRREYNKRLCMVRENFDGLIEYNDYLEKVTCIVFDIIYGDAGEKTAAETEVQTFYEANKHVIDENFMRSVASERERLETEESGKPDMVDDTANDSVAVPPTAGGGGGLQEMILPVPLQGDDPAIKAAQEREDRIPWQSMTPDKRRERMQKTKTKKIAGGFKNNYHTERVRQDAFAGLFSTFPSAQL